jgi:hypothetical protein
VAFRAIYPLSIIAPVAWTLSGLCCDIIGALLVAVEAVKLSNIRALRDRVFEPLHRAVQPIPIVWEEGESHGPRRSDWFGRWILAPWWPWLAFHAFMAAMPIVLLDVLLRRAGLHLIGDAYDAYARSFASHPYWIKAVLVFVAVCAALILTVTLGEFMHQTLLAVCALPIKALTFIDRKTPDGTVGIIGAVFLVVGFSLQVVGAIASSARH